MDMDGAPALTGTTGLSFVGFVGGIALFILLLLCGRTLAVAQEQALLSEEVL